MRPPALQAAHWGQPSAGPRDHGGYFVVSLPLFHQRAVVGRSRSSGFGPGVGLWALQGAGLRQLSGEGEGLVQSPCSAPSPRAPGAHPKLFTLGLGGRHA